MPDESDVDGDVDAGRDAERNAGGDEEGRGAADAGASVPTSTDGGTADLDVAADVEGDVVPEDWTERPAVRRVRRGLRRLRRNRLAATGLVVVVSFALVAAFPGELATHPFDATNVPERLQGPSPDHPMGTDRYGRDVYSRVVFGARVAFVVAVLTPAVAAAVGVPVGLVAGYYGGRLDDLLMRAMDSLFAFPTILLGLTLVAVFGQSLTNIVLALGIVFVPQFARVTRGSALSAAREDHVTVARSLGASDRRIIALHVFPFCVSAVLVQATVTAALAVVLESSLSFLGVGVPPPRPSWGAMLRVGKGFVGSGEWWYSVFPGLAIVVAVLGFNLLGDGLRDVLDPRSDPDR